MVGAINAAGETGLEPMMDLANGVLSALVEEGRLDEAVYTQMNIPSRPRSHAETIAPFKNLELPALALEELIIADTPNAAMLRWQQTGFSIGDWD